MENMLGVGNYLSLLVIELMVDDGDLPGPLSSQAHDAVAELSRNREQTICFILCS